MLPIRPGFRELARRVMEDRIEQREGAETIAIAASSVKSDIWEDEREFRLDGRLYDVVSVSYTDGKKYYQCYSDELEVSAEKEADNLVSEIIAAKPASPQGKVARALADWLNDLYHTQTPLLRLHSGPLAETAYQAFLLAAPTKPGLQRFAPPPEV